MAWIVVASLAVLVVSLAFRRNNRRPLASPVGNKPNKPVERTRREVACSSQGPYQPLRLTPRAAHRQRSAS